MLSQRILFGAVLIIAVIVLIYVDQVISRSMPAAGRGLIVLIVIEALVVLGTIELTSLFKSAGHSPLRFWPIIINLLLVIAHIWRTVLPSNYEPTILILSLGFAGVFFFVAARRQTEGAIANMATTVFAILYLGLLPQFLMGLRIQSSTSDAWLLLYFVATVKISDIGAYFTGYFLGKHKMIPWLSPKKTWEGLAGGVLASIAMAIVFPLIAGRGDLSAGLMVGLSYPKAILFGVLMAVVGQAGDLLESLIKRDAQAKDSAAAVPAFGGVLDIIDSLLLTAPLAYWMLVK